jgi:hypothetical protein
MTKSQRYLHMKHLSFWERNLLQEHSIQIQREAIHVITIYKPSILLFLTFINQLQTLLYVMPTYCPTIITSDFNIDMFDQNSTQPNQLNIFMNQYSIEI